ncbi:MAG TPA: ATP phosphoribosyltransferase [Candidatus Acidoferrales bacterium]|nr:ATP phosphoribosyltransferase [Candidatus Acidoferrales bacterium]
MLRIALPNKGRLADETRELFEDAGLDVRTGSPRALVASLGGVFEALFVRAQDIAEFVADGAADVGVTGHDLVAESGRELDTLLDLGFGRCRLVLAAHDERGAASAEALLPGTRVATSFPRIAREFFERRHLAVEIVPVSGAAEIAPHVGIADVVVDLTSTGSTMRVNGLREIETLLESTARLVSRPGARAADENGTDALGELVMALESVLRARGRRYVMANVPRSALPEVRAVLPGLNGPTVTEVLDGGRFVAVHAVVAADVLMSTISGLRRLGAEGILVTRIERLVP